MKRIRNFITLLVLVLSTTATAAAVVVVLRTPLPVRSFRTHADTVEWLVTEDFPTAQPHMQRQIVRRFEQDFMRNVDWADTFQSLSDAQRERFTSNFAELMRFWFMEKVNAFAKLEDEEQQRDFLRNEFVKIASWQVPTDPGASQMDPLTNIFQAAGFSEALGGPAPMFLGQTKLVEHITRWLNEATPEEHQRIGEFIVEVENYVMEMFSGERDDERRDRRRNRRNRRGMPPEDED